MQDLSEKIDTMMLKAARMHQFIQYLLQERSVLQSEVAQLQAQNAVFEEEIARLQNENQEKLQKSPNSSDVSEVKQRIDVYIQEIDQYLKKINDSVLT